MRDWLIHIKRGEYASLQTQIREALVSAILDRKLDKSEPIPSTRKMAKSLGVSRNTVVLAYQGLLDDGYLLAKERSGYFVSDKAIDDTVAKPRSTKNGIAKISSNLDWMVRVKQRPNSLENAVKPLDWQDYNYPFIYGQVDHTLFPLAEWRDCTRQALGKKWFGAWTNDTWATDDPLLVEQIRRRILPRRGIMATDDEILVTLGAQNSLFLLTSLLVDRNTTVATFAALDKRADQWNKFTRAKWFSAGVTGGSTASDCAILRPADHKRCDKAAKDCPKKCAANRP